MNRLEILGFWKRSCNQLYNLEMNCVEKGVMKIFHLEILKGGL